jgi:hypothetical protein
MVDPSNGVIIIVQPSDFNNDCLPPVPIIDAVTSFQSLTAQAAVLEIPVVVVSPRLHSFVDRVWGAPSCYQGWEQSGYQKSSSYGGHEPPRGPTPWILRDFHPPVLTWIGTAVKLNPVKTKSKVDDTSVSRHRYYGACEPAIDSRLCLFQSMTLHGHSWNLYVARESGSGLHSAQRFRTNGNGSNECHLEETHYQYLASTANSAGRPTRDIMRRIYYEFTDGVTGE